jgi:UDP-N-acetylmuramate--alanine ligase
MLAFFMQRLGMGPNFIGGGRVKQFRTGNNPGNYMTGNSEQLVVEACESDGTLIHYRPSFTIISNLDLDHHSIGVTAGMFEQLSENTRDFVVLGGDDKNLAKCNIKDAIRFSIEEESGYKAEDVKYYPFSTVFKVNRQRFELSLPGRHNLYNALACIAFLSELGVTSEKIAAVLPEFIGIERRFDIHLNDGRFLVVDDYAHNPHKIESLMRTLHNISNRVCYIFQPHGYGPVRLMKEGYIRTFAENLRASDHLVLLPIYYAGGTAAKDVSSSDLAKGISDLGRSVKVIEDRRNILEMIGKCDSYVVLGARDDSLSDLAQEIAVKLRQ